MQRKNSKGRTRQSLAIENLESRRLLSGVVTSTLSAGTLTIKGDGGDNAIDVDGTGGVITITGVGPTFVTFPNVFPAGAVTSIKVQLGDGNDNANIHDLTAANGEQLLGPTGLNITDDKGNDFYSLFNVNIPVAPVTIAAGQGNNTINLNTVNASTITTSTTGASTNIDFVTFNSVVAGKTSITGGGAVNIVNVLDTSIVGSLSISTGDGNDNIQVGVFGVAGFVQVLGSLTVDAGKGNDSISMGNDAAGFVVFVNGNLKVNAKEGFDLVNMQDVTVFNIGGGVSTVDGGSNNDLLHLEGFNAGWTAVGFEGFF